MMPETPETLIVVGFWGKGAERRPCWWSTDLWAQTLDGGDVTTALISWADVSANTNPDDWPQELWAQTLKLVAETEPTEMHIYQP